MNTSINLKVERKAEEFMYNHLFHNYLVSSRLF